MRLLLPLVTLLAACGAAAAQAPLAQEPMPLEGRHNQKVERIVIEDQGSRVEEVRVGGQTQSVTVQPGGGAPVYELQPSDLARNRPVERRDGGGAPRVWNLLSF